MAAIDKIVQVTVTKTTSTVSRRGFGTALGLFQIDTGVQSDRYKTYSTLQELLDAGFVETDPAYKWATAIVSQDPRPIQFALGRQIPGTKKVSNITIDTPEAGTWLLDVSNVSNSTQYQYIATGSDTTLTIAEGLRQAIEDDPNRFVDVEAGPLVSPDFDTSDLAADTLGIGHTLGPVTPPGAGAATITVPTAAVAAENIITALNAVQTENNEWYIFNIESRSTLDVSGGFAFAATNLGTKHFVGQTSDEDIFTGTTPNLGTQMNGFGYKNGKLMVTKADTQFMDGAMAGVGAAARLDGANGQITWAYKTLIGITPDDLTTDEQNNVEAAHGDYYLEVAGQQITMTGKNTDDEFTDVRTTLDWTQSRVKESVFGTIVTQPNKLPYTNVGIGAVKAAVLGVLDIGAINGHFTTDDPELPRVTAPSNLDIPQADKDARILRNVVGEAKLSGAIHQAIIQVNVSV